MIEEFPQFVVFPRRFDDMVIGDDCSVWPYEKASTEDVDPEMWPRAAVVQLRHVLVVDEWLARSIDGDLDGRPDCWLRDLTTTSNKQTQANSTVSNGNEIT